MTRRRTHALRATALAVAAFALLVGLDGHDTGHWLIHVLGIDTQQSWAYDYWSGVGTQVSLPNVVLAVLWYRHNSCHRPWCPRLGKHRPDGTPYCTHHCPTPVDTTAAEETTR